MQLIWYYFYVPLVLLLISLEDACGHRTYIIMFLCSMSWVAASICSTDAHNCRHSWLGYEVSPWVLYFALVLLSCWWSFLNIIFPEEILIKFLQLFFFENLANRNFLSRRLAKITIIFRRNPFCWPAMKFIKLPCIFRRNFHLPGCKDETRLKHPEEVWSL